MYDYFGWYIYYNKFDDIEAAKNAIQNKDDKPYNSKMSMVKIENWSSLHFNFHNVEFYIISNYYL